MINSYAGSLTPSTRNAAVISALLANSSQKAKKPKQKPKLLMLHENELERNDFLMFMLQVSEPSFKQNIIVA